MAKIDVASIAKKIKEEKSKEVDLSLDARLKDLWEEFEGTKSVKTLRRLIKEALREE